MIVGLFNGFIFLGFLVVSFSSIVLYYQARTIYQKFSVEDEAVEKEEVGANHSKYSERYRNVFPVKNIVIPVYRKGSSFQKVVVDFHIVSSNFRVKEYFWMGQNIHLIHDRLNSQMAPMDLEFPLEEEGKMVIRDKVRREINRLVRELEIEGEIEEVYIGRLIVG